MFLKSNPEEWRFLEPNDKRANYLEDPDSDFRNNLHLFMLKPSYLRAASYFSVPHSEIQFVSLVAVLWSRIISTL